MFQNPEMFILRIPAILIALTIHEFAHGYVAWLRGDNTAHQAGRLSLNPLAHLDLFGTVMMLFGPFGWAKPVPVNSYNFKNPKRDIIWVAAAGPVSNILLALIMGFSYRFLLSQGIVMHNSLSSTFFQLAILLNLGLAFFNLIPIPPLDGSNILMGLLPTSKIEPFLRFMRFAPTILFVLLLAEWGFHIPVFSTIIDPIWNPWLSFWQFVIFGS